MPVPKREHKVCQLYLPGRGCRHRSADMHCDNGGMSESADSDKVEGWSPAPDVGQAGTVLTKDGQWAYRYKDGADLILMKMPERPAPA